MSVTRSCPNNIYIEIERFFEDFVTKEKLEGLGWRSVPIVDVNGAKTWKEVANVFKSDEYSNYLKEEFFCYPVAITNHNLFKVNKSFLNEVLNIDNFAEFLASTDLYFSLPSSIPGSDLSNRESRINSINQTSDNRFNHSYNVSLSLQNLVTFEMPSNISFSSFDAIVQFNAWYTEGHIELAGNESISYTPIGSKIFLIAERGSNSVLLEKRLRGVNNFMKFVKEGNISRNSLFPKSHSIRFYIPNEEHFLCQPALCAHAVLTGSIGPSIVMGFEGFDSTDRTRSYETLSGYGNGLRNNSFKRLLEIQGVRGAAEWCNIVDKELNRNTGLTEHLNAIVANKQTVLIPSSSKNVGRPSGPSKKRKQSFNFPNEREKYYSKRMQENGKILHTI